MSSSSSYTGARDLPSLGPIMDQSTKRSTSSSSAASNITARSQSEVRRASIIDASSLAASNTQATPAAPTSSPSSTAESSPGSTSSQASSTSTVLSSTSASPSPVDVPKVVTDANAVLQMMVAQLQKQQVETVRENREQYERTQEQIRHLSEAVLISHSLSKNEASSRKKVSTPAASSRSASSSDALTPRLNTSAMKKAAFIEEDDTSRRSTTDDDVLDRDRDSGGSEDDDDDIVYRVMNEWLRLRQQVYPAADSRYRQHYYGRCSLLSLHGRHNEYFRFGLRVGFPKRLYPSTYLQWFTLFRKEFGDLPSTRPAARSSSAALMRTLTVPTFIYEHGELPQRTSNYDDNDLSEHSVTLKSLGLPDVLLVNLRKPSIWHYSPPSLEQIAYRYLIELTHRVSGDNATTHTAHDNQASVSDFRDKSQDVRDHAGPSSSSLVIQEYDDSYSINRSRSAPNYGDGTGISSRSSSAAARSSSNSNSNSHSNSNSSRNRSNDTRHGDNRAVSSTNESRSSTGLHGLPNYNPRGREWMDEADWSDVPHLEDPRSSSDSAAYFSDPHGSFQRVKREADRNRHNSPANQQFRNEHVLGDILNLLDKQTRNFMALTRNTRTLSSSDLQKAISATVLAVGTKFDGSPDKAPHFFHSLVTALSQYQFTSADVVAIMRQVMTGSATAWFMNATMKVSDIAGGDERRVVPALLGLFRDHYLNSTHVIRYRALLNDVKLTDRVVTSKELQLHYTRFVSIANNLKLCDNHMTDELIKQTFVESLPPQLRAYIGISYKDKDSVDEVYQQAEEACRALHPKRKVDLDNDDLSLNSLHLRDSDDSFDDNDELIPEIDNQRVWFMSLNLRGKRPVMSKEDIDCWHCGIRGHFAGECSLHAKNLPQTAKGAEKYAEFNRMRGKDRPYDADFQKERSRQIQDRRDNPSSRSGPRRSDNRRKRNIPAVSGTVAAVTTRQDRVQVQSHIIELYDQSDDDAETECDSDKHIVQLSSIDSVDYAQSSLAQVREREKSDATSATSMCLPIELNGVSVGYALGDQGATKSIIRASALDKLGVDVREHAVVNHFVMCANGSEVPIRSRFNAMISSDGTSLGDSLVYVVDDSGKEDITCDMVLGRSTMASSRFNCIDTKKGALFDKQSGDEIQCLPAQFITVRSKHHLVPRPSSGAPVVPSFGRE
jgi:hypothetical protein